MSDETNPPLDAAARKDSLIEFPSLFPIKVMGAKVDGFAQAIADVARQFDPHFHEERLSQRDSSGGKYQGLTLTIHATSREQLDALYRALSSHPMVKMVL